MKSWMEWFPERLETELDSYRRNAIEIDVDESSKARGILSLHATVNHDESTHRIRVEYPSLFPYFQPMAFLLDEQLERHQAPESGHLCLLGRGTDQWDSGDSFGDILATRFPIIFQINRENDLVRKAELEEPQGEPYTEYFNGAGVPGSAILYQDSWRISPEISMGIAILECARSGPGKKSAAPLVGLIKTISKKQDVLASWEGPSFNQFPSKLHIPWVRLQDSPQGMGQTLIDQLTEDQKAHVGLNKLSRTNSTSFLVIFTEEAEQFQYRDGIACVTLHPRISTSKKGKVASHQIHYQRTFRAGAEELQARMPGIFELAEKNVVVFGLGAIGSFAGLELARAGIGTLCLVDFDYVEPATVRRWALGASAFGQQKADALEQHISDEYPWTSVTPIQMKIGDLQPPGNSKNQFDEIVEVIDKHDLVIDLTAEFGVNELLSMISAKMKTPYLRGSATAGAWGGYIAYFTNAPHETCWTCMTHDLYGKEWADDLPPSDPAGTLQPPGCPSITFTGTSVDLQEISMEAVRQALGILTVSFPLPEGQLSILRHRQDDGRRLVPQWKNRAIKPREGCGCN